MRVRITQAIAGPRFTYRAGEIVEMDEEQATKWIAGKLAVRVDHPPAPPPQPIGKHDKHRRR